MTAARNARLGRNLFLVYLVFYLGYVLLTTLAPDVMKREAWSGINIAVAYGFGLIKLALILALVYAWLCRNAVGEGAAK